MTVLWTHRDLDLLEGLTRRVRLLTVEQVAAGWWPGGGLLRVVRRRLRALAGAGLIEMTVVNAHPLLPVTGPLVRWNPGAPSPDCDHISQLARERWKLADVPQQVVYAGQLAANLFGSSAGRLPKLEQRDHDLLLGQVYIHYRRQPDGAVRWLGDDALSHGGYGVKKPDALLVDEAGHVVRVVESAGRHSPTQIEQFHVHCTQHDLPYELW